MDYVITIWNHTNLCAEITAVLPDEHTQFDPAAGLQVDQHVSAWSFVCARVEPIGNPDAISAEVHIRYGSLWLPEDEGLQRPSGGLVSVRFGWTQIPRQARRGYVGTGSTVRRLRTRRKVVNATLDAFYGDVQIYLKRGYAPPLLRRAWTRIEPKPPRNAGLDQLV